MTTTFRSGDKVSFMHYGERMHAEVVGSDNRIVFVEDTNRRRRWKHAESLTLEPRREPQQGEA